MPPLAQTTRPRTQTLSRHSPGRRLPEGLYRRCEALEVADEGNAQSTPQH
jgi:hypothetical protein